MGSTKCEWLAAALRLGAEGIPFAYAERVHLLVPTLYHQTKQAISTEDDGKIDRKHLYFSAVRTARGAALDLCLLLLFWMSKDTEDGPGREPRSTLIRSPDVRSILEAELEDRSTSGWVPRAVLGRYLTWLFFFGEDWLWLHFEAVFPPAASDLAAAAWFGYVEHDKPAGELVAQLHPYFAAHIRHLKQQPPGYEELGRRLADFLMVLFLWDEVPEDLLELFWTEAPTAIRRHAMWFIGREMLPGRQYQERAKSYWGRRLKAAIDAQDPEPFRKELGATSSFFLWDLDQLWLLDQLRTLLLAGFVPNDTFGVIDKLARLVPEHVDKVVEVTSMLVRQPNVEAWTFAAQDRSLRHILVEGKSSQAPHTVVRVREIVSFLASRGNTGFLDLDDGLLQ